MSIRTDKKYVTQYMEFTIDLEMVLYRVVHKIIIMYDGDLHSRATKTKSYVKDCLKICQGYIRINKFAYIYICKQPLFYHQ